jgi:hypothetical protein
LLVEALEIYCLEQSSLTFDVYDQAECAQLERRGGQAILIQNYMTRSERIQILAPGKGIPISQKWLTKSPTTKTDTFYGEK